MDEKLRITNEEARIFVGQTETEEYPLPVADDWDELVAKSKTLADIIDTHLDFEEKLQGISMRPSVLCPEQRVSLATDLLHASK